MKVLLDSGCRVKRRDHTQTPVLPSEPTASSPATQETSCKSATNACASNKVQALLMAERVSGTIHSERALLYTLCVTAGVVQPPSSSVASRDIPFIKYNLVPPLRGDKFRPSRTFFPDADIPGAALEEPKRARASPTNSEAIGSAPEKQSAWSRRTASHFLYRSHPNGRFT